MSQPSPPGGWPDPADGSHQLPQPPPGAPPQWQPPSVPVPPIYPGPAYGPPAPVPPGFGYPPPPPRTNGLAITSMVMSISGLVVTVCGTFCFLLLGLLGLPLGVTGAILGHVGIRQIRERGEHGHGMALAGAIVGWITAGIGAVVIVLIILYFVGLFSMFALPDANSFDDGVSW